MHHCPSYPNRNQFELEQPYKMKRKILLPTDYSKNSWHAINYAIELYKSDRCDFYLLNVFYVTSNLMKGLMNMDPGSELYETARAYSEDGLAKVLDMLTLKHRRNPKHCFYTISTFNNPVEAIKIVVDEKDIDIIVMGTKGETASKIMNYGSTAVNVMEKVRNCPVIVVPEKAKISLPREIVFPTNYKIPFKRRELNYIIEIAKKAKASVQIVYINEGDLKIHQLENKSLLKEYFSNINYTFRELSYMPVPEAINCFVESRGSDMIAFINRKHIFFGNILNQALVKHIGFSARVPILVMHDLKN